MKIGEIYPTNFDGDVEILEDAGNNAFIKFLNTGNTRWVIKCNLAARKISDKQHRTMLAEQEKVDKLAGALKRSEEAMLKRETSALEKIKAKEVKNLSKAAKLAEKLLAQSLKDAEKAEKSATKASELREAKRLVSQQRMFEKNEAAKAKFMEVGLYGKVLVNDFIEDGEYSKGIRVDGRQYYTRSYSTWACILQRSTEGGSFQSRFSHYVGTTVCDEWREDYQSFARWYNGQIGYSEGWDVDKDILSSTKQYGPDTCILLPRSVNLMFAERSKGFGLADATKLDGIPRWRHKDGIFFTDLTEAANYIVAERKMLVDSLRDIYTPKGLPSFVFDKLEHHLCNPLEVV